ncbi:TIM barrel protein [Aeoliella mucimassa]|uniref:Xylose isomerase n=1 Tax=Aeoliella mucimassa TaxID=2527972 RepID=A0A518AQH9_9BACT|nr:TIM barrel protein [Aeoliella mucimassa]QDU56979.1 Xylose isomerase [Aeoliella mucimassa]
MTSQADYKFSFGPWNIHEGADPFGPTVRDSVDFAAKIAVYKRLGFDGVQLHDDDAVADLEDKSWDEIQAEAKEMRRLLESEGLEAEFVAPRLWEDPRGIDGGLTANDPEVRRWGVERSKKAVDIAKLMGTDLVVLWLAREGTYIRESKSARVAYDRLVEAINTMLQHDPTIRIAIEPKPNEPMDQAYVPTIGHALALAERTCDPQRVGGLIETAHAQLAGLDPSDEMAFALGNDKLWSVHLNDQNGLKFDQDKSFGSANLRAAFNQVRVLEEARYFDTGRYIGLDVKAMRTQEASRATQHLANSKAVFEALVQKARTFPEQQAQQLIADRDYESLEMLVLSHLMGVACPELQQQEDYATQTA